MTFTRSRLNIRDAMRILLGVVLLAAFAAVLTHAQQPSTRGRQNAPADGAAQAQPRKANDGDVHLLRVRGNVSMLVGAGGNITVQAGEQGIALVDTGSASAADKVAALIRPLSPKPVTYIINTDGAPDHIGGNLAFGTPAARGAMVNIISYLSVLDRVSAPVDGKPPAANAGWPNDTYSEAQRNLYFNGEAIQIFHQTGNTDGNSIVLFRGSDVVSTGDIFDPTQYPVIDLKKGGSIQGELDALNRLKSSILVPELHYEGGTLVIPGHGRLCDAADVAVYQQMVTIIRDRIQYMIKMGMTLEQVKAAKLTQDFDPIYGSNTGNWTTDMFVEAVYNSLKGKLQTSQSRAN